MVGTWGVAHNEVKGGFGGSRVGPGIVYVLGKREPTAPGGLTVVYEDAKILFKPLIHLFRLAVCLGMIGRAYVLFDV